MIWWQWRYFNVYYLINLDSQNCLKSLWFSSNTWLCACVCMQTVEEQTQARTLSSNFTEIDLCLWLCNGSLKGSIKQLFASAFKEEFQNGFQKMEWYFCNTREKMNSQLGMVEFRRNDKCNENWWCYITGKKGEERQKDCTLERKRWVIFFFFFFWVLSKNFVFSTLKMSMVRFFFSQFHSTFLGI